MVSALNVVNTEDKMVVWIASAKLRRRGLLCCKLAADESVMSDYEGMSAVCHIYLCLSDGVWE